MKPLSIHDDSHIHDDKDDIVKMKSAYVGALEGDTQAMKNFYKNNPNALFDTVTVSRNTAFHVAATKNCPQLLNDLLQMVPPDKSVTDVLTKKDVYGNTPLHEVAATDNLETARLLVNRLLNPDEIKKNQNQEKRIREKEALLKLRNNAGETPVYRAAAFGKQEMLKFLVEQVEHVGDLRDHYRRYDLISILHIAVIGQHFETAIWLLNREGSSDGSLALQKEESGMTCFQLLATMKTAFRSSCPMSGFRKFIYYCLPNFSAFDDDHDNNGFNDGIARVPFRTKEDIESGKIMKSLQRSLFRSKVSKVIWRMYCAFWKGLAEVGYDKIDETLKLKHNHELANKLAKILVRLDTSWAIITNHVNNNTICVEEGRRQKGLETKTALLLLLSAKKRRSSQPDTALLIAASHGILEIVNMILDAYPQAIEHVSLNGQNILHVAIMHRQLNVFESLDERAINVSKLGMVIDRNGYTILHHAADISFCSGGTTPGAAFQLQEELKWSERVEKLLPTHYTMHRNKDGVTADELFKVTHDEQYNDAKKWISNISESCSTVAALVASVVFAAAFGVPGGFRGEAKLDSTSSSSNSTTKNVTRNDYDDSGLPVLLHKPLFSVFSVMDVLSLTASLTSVVLFLSILTSSCEMKHFLRSLPQRLTLAFSFLFFSVTCAMSAFTSTIFLTVQPKNEWVKNLTYVAAFVPISLFLVSQYSLLLALLATLKDAYVRMMMIVFPRFLRSLIPCCSRRYK